MRGVALTGIFLVMLMAAAGAGHAAVRVHVEDGILEARSASVFVGVAPGVSLARARAAARAAGLRTHWSFPQVRFFHATGPGRGFARLVRTRLVRRLEVRRAVPALTDTSHRATRGQEVLDGALGTRYDGSGVGVAVVDGSFDSSHPDLAGRIGAHFRMVPGGVSLNEEGGATAVPVPTSETGMDGHGTHVAGTVAGTGAGSSGRFHGAAPGATLHLFSTELAPTRLINPHEAWQWILDNGAELNPPVRVINNSFAILGTEPYDPQSFVTELVEAVAKAGVTMVIASGNAGPGTADGICASPVPGIICVADYDDGDTGTKDGAVAESSSGGQPGRPVTYPDVMAPGSYVTAPCRPWLPVCHLGPVPTDARGYFEDPLEYWTLSGTSMAAPHVAGIVAQLLQARPELTPADVQRLLAATAFKTPSGSPYTPDPVIAGTTTSPDKGHGLVDARAAIEAALASPAPGAAAGAPAPPAATPPGAAARDTRAPRIGRLTLSQARVRRSAVGRVRVRFAVDEAARVTIELARGARAVARSRRSVRAGGHSLRLASILRGRRLRAGRWELRITAVDAAGNASRRRRASVVVGSQ